ncbi:MAG TPA: hypothetical protein VHM90_16135 [Phycisphaerae bacterium]|nr:hypothetical protein [Phycisphaerae bacterium]
MEAKKFNDDLLDAAACDAIGSHTHEESAAYQHELAAAGAPARTLDRQMRQTVATLAAASPHMEPSSDLRARILQATAPRSFRLEDYKKASREDMRFYKWGFYAAAVFLVFAGLYNISVRGGLDQANANYKKLQQEAQAMASNDQQHVNALAAYANLVAYANPKSVPFFLSDDKKQVFARGIVDLQNKTAVIMMPQEMVAAGVQPQLTLDIDGTKQAFTTTVLCAPAVQVGLAVPDNGKIPSNFEFKNQGPNANTQIRNAGWH